MAEISKAVLSIVQMSFSLTEHVRHDILNCNIYSAVIDSALNNHRAQLINFKRPMSNNSKNFTYRRIFPEKHQRFYRQN